ncbi:tRNA (N6-isopentenyl adenosine(37)-C2)-methylthiotransferase MiaB [Salisediminibacterium halotolerans]|uniref:tRNA-2-methylthio-N(6)-dimethylallyladenosine synthase n=1 Tax=Salisediminibacterium halotolerans TaxID=517425 RepID=A0A1H9W6G8_9BACI|nr:tRNA (N6-isopentenyl adenosine(37)-C2)-methylthiotransferase MiaB [Salisediminibacterium haloalkalitolerans]SES29522.1 tRNA-2-methylthio-N6-dimethylallyladenosine synthase [Salisediminibacterium haloalkalitolerans]
MNEEQKNEQMRAVEEASSADKKSGQEKDYSQYFQTTYTPPDLKQAKKRGKEDVDVHYDFTIPDDMKEIGVGKKFLIRTYGCQMNEHDSENMAGILLEMGFESTTFQEDADIILLNTCAIRENAENKVFGEIGHLKALKREKPELIIGVCGCMSQEESVVNRILEKHQQVDLIFGTHNIHRLPELIKNAIFEKEMVVEVWSKEGDIIENMPRARKGKIQGWVNIMYGCDKFCTYCIVPFTRGKERSRLPEDVIEEVRHLARNGYKEITLLGQNVNAYGKDLVERNYRLADLLDEIRQIGIPRVRFTTSHPWDFEDELIEVLAKGGNMMEHIHLPVQSGNNDVLKIMNRKYTREGFIELAGKIRKAMPHASFTTDIIVGYPNETEEQFQDTLSLMTEMQFDAAYTYIYSPREGTPAAQMEDNVPNEVKKERLQRLNAVVNDLSNKSNKKLEGEVVEVLVEGESKKNAEVLMGRTRTNKLVNFRGEKSLIGQLVNVRVTEAKTWSLDGEVAETAGVK